MSSKRFMLKSKSGRWVKVRKMELYSFQHNSGFRVDFQEQHARTGGNVHTHIWFYHDKDDQKVADLYHHILFYRELYPNKCTLQCFGLAWELDEDNEVFEGPQAFYEIVIDRKLSKTLMDEIDEWLVLLYIDLIDYWGMTGLFGGVKE